MSRRYLIDANHIGAALAAKGHKLRARIAREHRAGFRFGTSLTAMFEAEVGIRHHATPVQLRDRMNWLLKIVRIWPLTESMTPVYAEIRETLRSRGRAASQFDMVLAAMARTMNATLLTTDRDFDALPEIPTENWFAELQHDSS
jgi:tRNA(fMet)-specific endonuclease VapC